MKNLNYYPLKRVLKYFWGGQMNVSPEERKSWKYQFTDWMWEELVVTANSRHDITSVTFTPKYKGIWLSLKRAQRKWYKACWFYGLT